MRIEPVISGSRGDYTNLLHRFAEFSTSNVVVLLHRDQYCKFLCNAMHPGFYQKKCKKKNT